MVFSFFKKKPPEPQRTVPARARTAPPGELGREAARRLAQQTTAKIDAIESEMTRDLAGPGSNPGGVMARPQAKAPLATPAAHGKVSAVPFDYDPGEDAATRLGALEVNTTSASATIDEAAILFSNGQAEAAEAVLRDGIAAVDPGRSRQRACLMLLELVNQRNDRTEFDRLADEFHGMQSAAMPVWHEYAGMVDATKSAKGNGATGFTARLPLIADASVANLLDEVRHEAARHAAVRLDVADVRTIDQTAAALMLRAINEFKASRGELSFVGMESLRQALQQAAQSSRTGPGDAIWMLWLEVLRILDQPAEYEEAAIEFCMAFELSPPSWEAALPNIRAIAEPSAGVDTSGGRIEWQGVIDGDGDRHLRRIEAASATTSRVVIDCRELRRLAFPAASALQTLGRRLSAGGKTLELRNVNPLVAALLQLMGVVQFISVHQRSG